MYETIWEEDMITINYDLLTLFDMVFLLSNYDGYLDGDKKCLTLTGKK